GGLGERELGHVTIRLAHPRDEQRFTSGKLRACSRARNETGDEDEEQPDEGVNASAHDGTSRGKRTRHERRAHPDRDRYERRGVRVLSGGVPRVARRRKLRDVAEG